VSGCVGRVALMLLFFVCALSCSLTSCSMVILFQNAASRARLALGHKLRIERDLVSGVRLFVCGWVSGLGEVGSVNVCPFCQRCVLFASMESSVVRNAWTSFGFYASMPSRLTTPAAAERSGLFVRFCDCVLFATVGVV
jgi:hypothetical protein